jgi:hypothetical protein
MSQLLNSRLPLEASSCKVHVFHRTYTNHYYSVAGIETSSISTLPPESLLPREEMASHMTWQSFLAPHSIISNQFLLHPRVPRCHHVRTTGCDCEFLTRSSRLALPFALIPAPNHLHPAADRYACKRAALSKCVSASRRRWVLVLEPACELGPRCGNHPASMWTLWSICGESVRVLVAFLLRRAVS